MLARIQQLIVVSILVAVVGAAALAIAFGRPWWPAAIVALLGVGYAGTLAVEFWLLRRSYGRADPLRPTFGQLLRAWFSEAVGTPRVFLWRQPFRSRRHADVLPDPPEQRRGVLLVHGFFCNRGLWNPWLGPLRDAGVPVAAVSLAPIFGSIDAYGPAIDTAVRELERSTGLPPVIVAHSMGGLAVRAWIADAATDETRWHRVVTIASPHAGTRLARHGHGTNVGQMRHGSDWLAALARRERTERHRRFVCFWSHCDNIVFPTRSATLEGADNRHLDATPHVQMAYHPAVIAEVLRLVAADPIGRQRPTSPRRSP